jgi:polar amino acid transport system substrate-binding protein
MRGTRLWLVLGLIGLLATAIVAAGCGDDDDEGSTTAGGTADLGTIEEGQLLVGVDTPYPPFEIGQPPDITGYDIEIMNAVAEDLGLEVTYQDTSFDTIFRDVGQGKFDTAAAATTILPERERTVDFSDPYYEASIALVVPEGSDIASVDDLAGQIVATQDATTPEQYANDETDASEVRAFPEGPDAINAVRNGQAEAALIDQPVAVDAVEKEGGVEIAEEIPTKELFGFGFGPDSDALREAFNESLQKLKDDGTIDELYEKYFQTAAPASVLEGTNEPT